MQRSVKALTKLSYNHTVILSMELEQWNPPPRLQSLILHRVTRTNKTIGCGSYGSVEEVAIPGALCAAKKIHDFLTKQDPRWLAKEVAESNIQKFVSECELMSRLQHPHSVQFLGLWWENDSSLHLVMEKMLVSLHDLLVPDEPAISRSPSVPHGIRCSVLQDTARGVAFLHSQKPPIIHRDLSARNILLNSAMTAKIADLGMARMVPATARAAMTKVPGALVYMPPEALDDESRHDTSIDVFAIGVLTVFVLAGEFPHNLKAPTYTDRVKGLVARSELERREVYTEKIHTTFPTDHPLIQLVVSCLENDPKSRPSIDRVLELLCQALTGLGHTLHSRSKLELIQLLENSSTKLDLLRKV